MMNYETENRIKHAEKFYASFLKYAQIVFADIANDGTADMESISKEITALRNEIQYNLRFLLYARHCIEPVSNEIYLASHAVHSTVIAMVIGKYLKLPPHRLLELGIAAFLHDIGMLKLSRETFFKGLDLTKPEKGLVFTHPIHSHSMLKSFKCTAAITQAVLEHHERENGSGYPRKLTGQSISLYGKIIAVACSYEALSAKRSYKEAKDQHSGIVELIKNQGNQYDMTVIKALVTALSIYPIGTFVLLSNGKQGRVFDIDPANQHYPVVQVDKEIIIRTANDGISIVRPLPVPVTAKPASKQQ